MKNKSREKKPRNNYLGEFSVEVLGRRSVLVSGCTGILHYSDERIGVSAKKNSVWISGAYLTLCWAGDGRIMVSGEISTLELRGEI